MNIYTGLTRPPLDVDLVVEDFLHELVSKLNTQAVLMVSCVLSNRFEGTYKVAALAGTARHRAGPKPGKKALKPPLA